MKPVEWMKATGFIMFITWLLEYQVIFMFTSFLKVNVLTFK